MATSHGDVTDPDGDTDPPVIGPGVEVAAGVLVVGETLFVAVPVEETTGEQSVRWVPLKKIVANII
jgi:hypothetical protein